jgi:hypothetical protein
MLTPKGSRNIELATQSSSQQLWLNKVSTSWAVNFLDRLCRVNMKDFREAVQRSTVPKECEVCMETLLRDDSTLGMLFWKGVSLSIKMNPTHSKIWLFGVSGIGSIEGQEVMTKFSHLGKCSDSTLLPAIFLNAQLCIKCETTASLHYIAGTLFQLLSMIPTIPTKIPKHPLSQKEFSHQAAKAILSALTNETSERIFPGQGTSRRDSLVVMTADEDYHLRQLEDSYDQLGQKKNKNKKRRGINISAFLKIFTKCITSRQPGKPLCLQ